MTYKIYLKDDIGNSISQLLGDIPKIIEVNALDIQDGFLVKGKFRIPVEHILFIQEV